MKHMEVGEFTQKQEDEYFYDFIALSFSKEKVKKIFTANNMSATNLLELWDWTSIKGVIKLAKENRMFLPMLILITKILETKILETKKLETDQTAKFKKLKKSLEKFRAILK